jgi:hypothetical protein
MSYSCPAAASKPPYLARRTFGWLLCLIATISPLGKALAAPELVVRDVQVVTDEGVYELDARLELPLPEAARKAVESGLTLRLTYQIVVDRVRRYMLDDEIASLEQRYEISYHALSQRYLVRNLNTGEQNDFGTLQGALDRVCEIRGLPVIDTALVTPGPVYEGRIRAVLDLSTAPDVLGWLLFWSDDWSAGSDWTSWTLRP